MNIIIGLRGKGSSGKTSTIRILHKLLLENDYQQRESSFRESGGDFISIFSKNNKLIGITSSGDTYDLVHDCLQKLVDKDCNIIVCACRTFDKIPPGTNAAIMEFANYKNQFIEKTVETQKTAQTPANNTDARQLFLMIENMAALVVTNEQML